MRRMIVFLLLLLPVTTHAHDPWHRGWDDGYHTHHNPHRGWNRVVREPQVHFRGNDHVVIEIPSHWTQGRNPQRFFRQKRLCNKSRFLYNKSPVTYAPAKSYRRVYRIDD